MAATFANNMQWSWANLNLHTSANDQLRTVIANTSTKFKRHSQVQIWALIVSMRGVNTTFDRQCINLNIRNLTIDIFNMLNKRQSSFAKGILTCKNLSREFQRITQLYLFVKLDGNRNGNQLKETTLLSQEQA